MPFRSIQVKVIVYSRTFGRSVEVLKIRLRWTRGRILMRKPVRISLTEIYTLVKNVTALYEIDGITARPEKKDRFRYRASIIGIFLVSPDLDISTDFASDKCSFPRNDYKIPRKSSHADLSP